MLLDRGALGSRAQERGIGMGKRMGAAARRTALALVVVATVLACQSTYYDEYLASHPGFEPTLPRVDATLREVLAALHAPTAIESIDVRLSRLAIYRVDGEDWSEIRLDAIRRGTAQLPAGADYVVLVGWACSFEQGLTTRGSRNTGYYLFTGSRLADYYHYTYREQCRSVNEFRAARGVLVGTEHQALDRVSAKGTRISLTQAYRRGLAYVEAGRLEEARAMLVLGEQSYRAAAQRLRSAGRQAALADVQRMRQGLMRALGLEEKPR